MSNRRRTPAEKAQRKAARCPKCKSTRRTTKEYDDALLHICSDCQFPIREERS